MRSTASLSSSASGVEPGASGWDAWRRAWETRLVDAIPLPSAATGTVAAAAIVSLYLAVESVFGKPFAGPEAGGLPGIEPDALGFIAGALMTGYALAAGYAISAGNAATRERLRPSLPGRDSPGVSIRTSRFCGLAGVLAGVLFIALVDRPAQDLLALRSFTTDGLLSLIFVPIPFWLFSRAACFTIAGVMSVSDLAEDALSLDLLDPSTVAPIGRMALRASLLWIGAAALGSLTLVGSSSPVEYVTLTFLLGVGVASFLMPVRGVHRRIRRAKAEELARTRAELRRDRESVAARREDAEAAATRLPGLIAWEARIETVREWPFDTSTLMRFALYLLIPLGSWLGGALVERSVDVFLD